MSEEQSDEWQAGWEARQRALQAVLGPSDGMVGHAPVPFDLGADAGGAADILYFRQHLQGVVAVTAELIGRDDQVANALGNYELMMCARDDIDWGADLISKLAHYTLEAALEPGETMDIGSAVPEGSTIGALLFSEYARFDVGDRKCGLLLCVGITPEEWRPVAVVEAAQVKAALEGAGVFPFTDLGRKSTYPARRKGWLFGR